MIDLAHVSKVYRGRRGSVTALDDVTCAVQAGEFVAVRGPSGCGKSTLLLAAGGLLKPSAGEVVVNGQNLYALSPEARARFRANHIGFVFQQFHLVPFLSVMDNVLAASLAGSNAHAKERAEALVERFGLTARAHHVPSELSVGERQRAALARAVLNEPEVLLADEPTGNLDETNAENVLRHLAEFAAAGGAVLLVTHDARAAQHAHRALEIVEGKLNAEAVS